MKYFDKFVEKLTFKKYLYDNYAIYKNEEHPELGYIIRYEKDDYYNVGIGDYTIPEDFQLSFQHNEVFLRIGNVYLGDTKFKMTGMKVDSFTPSSFITIEDSATGIQMWKKGQHFHGTELTISKKYFAEILQPTYGNTCISLEDLPHNQTQKYLPAELLKVIHQIENISASKQFNEILLDSKVLECIGIMTAEYKQKTDNIFQSPFRREKIKIGNHRQISLSLQDIGIIRKAHNIIAENACHHLTISNISNMLHINEQKLKAGFSHLYHMTMWEYANSIRMTTAANLLVTTDISIHEIGEQVGYSSLGSFSNMFKKHFHISPNQFRTKNGYKAE